jgi:hypothetical protein
VNRSAELRLDPQGKIALHSQFADYIGGKKVYPIGLEISPSGICQASCDFCLPAGTAIDTIGGAMPVETIRQGDLVYGPIGNPSLVTHAGRRLARELVEIMCNGERLLCTPEHPILTQNGWKNAGRITCRDDAVVRVRVRDTSRQDERQVEQVRIQRPRRKGPENVCDVATSTITEDENKEPDEKPRDGQESLYGHTGQDSQAVGRGSKEHFRGGQKKNVFSLQPNEEPRDGSKSIGCYIEAADFQIREDGPRSHYGPSPFCSLYRLWKTLDSKKEPRLSHSRPEKSDRDNAIHSIHSVVGEHQEDAGELRPANDVSLQEARLEVPRDFSEAPAGDTIWAQPGDHRLRIAGIDLERGLALRPVNSVRRLTGCFVVYNFSCYPAEAYEADGFVVHNCFYANTGELGGHRNVMLDRDVLHKVIQDAWRLGVKAITWTGGGEPSLHPNIDLAVCYVSERGLDQGMFTNALAYPRYDPTLLSWIRVTMTDRPYNQGNIAALRAAKTLGFAFNYAGPQDDKYLWETLHLAEVVDADYVQVRPALKFHGQTVDIDPPNIDHPLLSITSYKFSDARLPHGYKTCHGHNFVPFLWEDGNLDVCGYMRKHEGYTLGNVYMDRLKDILDRAPITVPVIQQCQVCCKNHEINLAVHKARSLQDKNFP